MATLDFLTASQLVSAEQKITHGLSQYHWSQKCNLLPVYMVTYCTTWLVHIMQVILNSAWNKNVQISIIIVTHINFRRNEFGIKVTKKLI